MSTQVSQNQISKGERDRLRIPDGYWIALSHARDRIIASAGDLASLRLQVEELGADPESVWFERFVSNDDWQGAVELE